MTRHTIRFAAVLTLVAGAATAGLWLPAGSAASQPLWVQHVQSYPGGISNGVRARLVASAANAAALKLTAPASESAFSNVQMNTDCDPPLPQNETAVAFNTSDPSNVVAAANDFCGDGDWIGFTTDAGQTWTSSFKDPKTSNGERCFGGDPSVVYSARDGVFYLSTLCFFTTSPISEVQVWKSLDGGATWTPSTQADIVITNRAADGSIDGTVFYDKELLAVDNNPASAHYGRLYVTFIKFHMMLPSGRSDYCPAQLGFTDDAADAAGSTWTLTPIESDAPGSRGVGPGANQWALPVVDDGGGLNVAHASEDCNTAFDPALFFRRSSDGGASFGARIQIDKPGQFADNPSRQDLLPAKHARLPISPSMAFDPTRDRLLFVYQNNVNRGTSGADISLQTSDDFGTTWSNAQTISITGSSQPAPGDQFFPWAAVDGQGGYHVIWYDNRDDPGNKLIETFAGFSSDGGATWSNTLISTASWNPDKAFFSCGCFIGDYNALTLTPQRAYPVWTDGRNSPGQPLGQTDIFTIAAELS